jgi:hypothetical protein
MEAGGRIRLRETPSCLTAEAGGGGARIAACGQDPAQRFSYHRGGALIAATGRCLGVETAKVGHGGLIGQQGAHLRAESCRAYAPDQVFSAPHFGAPPV